MEFNSYEETEEYKKWRRFLEAANFEKQWMNERLKWFFTPQSILFAAFVLTYSKDMRFHGMLYANISRLIICVTGLFSSLCCLAAIWAAAKMHGVWYGEMIRIYNNSIYKDDITFGRGSPKPALISRWAPVAVGGIFSALWFSFFIFVIFSFFVKCEGYACL